MDQRRLWQLYLAHNVFRAATFSFPRSVALPPSYLNNEDVEEQILIRKNHDRNKSNRDTGFIDLMFFDEEDEEAGKEQINCLFC